MDLEVVGRHALLFDDDANAAFVNSEEALVEWNSLLIDRYDVRHLLSGPPPPRNLRRKAVLPADASLELELDRERFLDLPTVEQEQQDVGKVEEPTVDGGYHAIGFPYGKPDEVTQRKSNDVESVYHPPFLVPETLTQNLPPTEKVHKIMARTATFVSKHGGQSEIVLRVKQGDNPTFGFLMPDHHLHPYFRFLVDHQELLKFEVDGKSLEQEKKGNTRPDQTGGALSLLGSAYDSGDDEEGTTEDSPKPKKSKSQETVDTISTIVSHGSKSLGNTTIRNYMLCDKDKREKLHAVKQNPSINTAKSVTTSVVRRDSDALVLVGTATNKSQAPDVPCSSKVELPVLEPPSELKRVVEKIVEFILRNGKEFEAVLAEQDRKFGRFPFLLPSNQYHSYYLQVLQKTQELKSDSKGIVSEKHESVGHGKGKKTSRREGDAALSSGTGNSDIPNDYNKKEKFKMVLGKSKKDEQDALSKVNQPQPELVIDTEAAAAILKAATSGIKNPGLELFRKLSSGNIGDCPSDDSGKSSSFVSLSAPQPQSSIRERNTAGKPGVSVPVAKAMAEKAALSAASEADSSEASLTREQKLKAERLKRAKMFAAMIKSGAAPLKPEPLRGLSVEPPGFGVSSSGNGVENLSGKEREGSLVPGDVDTSEKIEKSEIKALVDESNERRSKRSYRSRSKREEEEEENKERHDDELEDIGDHKNSRKKHRSRRSSHHGGDKQKLRRRRSSSKDRESQHRQKHDVDEYSDDEGRRSRHRHKHDISADDDERRSSRKRREHRSSDDYEDEHHDRHSRHRHKHGGSSDNEGRHWSKSVKYREHRSEKELELEEGEICAKSDQSKANESRGTSREASVDLLKSHEQGNLPSQPSESLVVSDDLRAKIRAMLMATM